MKDSFSRKYEELRQLFSEEVGESRGNYRGASASIREELVRCLWFGSHFSQEQLHTDAGKRLEVLSPGWWNVEGGPDFKRAEILMEGKGRLVGDVEIHTRAPGWYGHGHHLQPEYNEVCLHVVMWQAQDDRPVQREDGVVIPQLTLSHFLDEEIDELIDIVDMEGEETGSAVSQPPMNRYCGKAMATGDMSPSWVGAILDCAGDQRVVSRAEHMTDEMAQYSPEEVLYVRLADALGYKNNRLPFRQIASVIPISMLLGIVPTNESFNIRRDTVEAAYFGVGGFLDQEQRNDDRETRDYVAKLRNVWDELPPELHERQMSDAHWDWGGTRPANFPPRRIAALASVYATYLPEGLAGHLAESVRCAEAEGRRRLDTVIRDRLTDIFTYIAHPYWNRRYSFGGRKLPRAQSLMGEQRSRAILVDVLIPFLVGRAQAESDQTLLDRIHLLWSRLPKRRSNTVVKRMMDVMFNDETIAKDVINSTRRQQGLHQVYSDFCAVSDGCDSCVIYLAHQSGQDLLE